MRVASIGKSGSSVRPRTSVGVWIAWTKKNAYSDATAAAKAALSVRAFIDEKSS